MSGEKCQACGERIYNLSFICELPCGAQVCDVCHEEDFMSAEDCPSTEPGTSPLCLDCIFSLVEAGPGYLVYSDADPGL